MKLLEIIGLLVIIVAGISLILRVLGVIG